MDRSGVLFATTNQQTISIITPPLHLPSEIGRVLVVSAACPDAGANGVIASVRLLWQTEERPDFHMEEQVVRLAAHPTEIDFALPRPASEMHRLGVQFQGRMPRLLTRGIEIPALTTDQKLDHFFGQFDVLESIQGYSVNFVRGPMPLGRSLNYYMTALSVMAIGVYFLSRYAAASSIRGGTIAAIALAAWFLADLPMIWRFARQVDEDRIPYVGTNDLGRHVAEHGAEVAWADEQLRRISSVGATFAVISDDPFAPAHRLAYLEAPLRTRRDHFADADFIFVCNSSAANFDADKRLFTLGDRPPIPATEAARFSAGVYLLRNESKGRTATAIPFVEPAPKNRVSPPWLILGILAPWAAGVGLVAALRRHRATIAGLIGTGWFVGQMLVIALLSLTLLMTGAGHARAVLSMLAIIGILSCPALFRHRPMPISETPARPAVSLKRASIWRSLVVVLLVGSIGIRAWYLALDQWSVSARCDDAISMWLFKAKSIAVLDRLPTDPANDYYLGGSNPHYPLVSPLIAAWLPMVAGQWEERVATMPWLLCYLNLLLLIGGGLRRWLTGSQALAAAYVVGSLPLLAMHVVRPGYSDLMLAAFLAGCVLYLLNWKATGQTGDLVLGGLFALTAACTKREGPPIVAITLVFLVGGSWRQLLAHSRAVRWKLAAATVLAIFLIFRVVGFSDHAENVAAMSYRSGIWAALARQLFVWDSFHTFYWLVAALLPLLIWSKKLADGVSAALLILCWCGLIAAIFVLTPQAVFALNNQTPSRLFLQITPSIVLVLAAILGTTVLRGRETPNGKL